jgi:CubicO group peptidase (beta-lactamase class C family)
MKIRKTDPVHDGLFTQLGTLVQEEMARLDVPGVAVGVIDGDQEEIATFGVTNIEHPLPVTEDTLFQIGSTTKTFTATIIMRLIEAGKLDLDTPVRAYLPGLRLAEQDVANRVTLRHLLSHSGGWSGDFFPDTGTGRDAIRRAVARLHSLPQITPLGSVWHYNNAGFYIAGRVIEVVTRKSYEQVAREMVLEPLGMNMTFFTADEVITYRVATGHNNPDVKGKHPAKIALPWGLPRNAAPVGRIISTVRDQLRYARFHLGDGTAEDGTRLLSPESMSLMRSPRIEAANGEHFGLGWFLRDMNGTLQMRHGGATNGQMSAFVLVPSRHWAITVLTNADLGRALHSKVTEWALEHYIGYRPPADEPIESAREDLEPYVGRYADVMVDLDVYLKGDKLFIQPEVKLGLLGQEMPPPEPPAALARYAADKLVVLDGPMTGAHMEFIREGKKIIWLRAGGRLYGRER